MSPGTGNEGTLYILRADGVGGEGGRGIGIERGPGRLVHLAGGRKVAVSLVGRQHLLQVGAELSVDFAAGEMRAVQQDLRADHGRALVAGNGLRTEREC